MHVRALLDEYVYHLRASGKSHNSIVSAIYHVRRFCLFLEAHGYSFEVEDITAGQVRQFITESGERYAPKTVRNNVLLLKTLWNWAVYEGILDRSPIGRVAVPKLPVRDVPVLSVDDVARLIAACSAGRHRLRDTAIVLVLFDTGIRADELVHLRPNDIDWNRRLLRVIGKGDKQRAIPVSHKTLRVVRRYLREFDDPPPALFISQFGDPLTYSGLRQLVERIGKRAGIVVHPHKLRHSFAVNALRNGAREFDIQMCLGHSTLEMTKHYARQTSDDLVEAHGSFSPASRLKIRV